MNIAKAQAYLAVVEDSYKADVEDGVLDLFKKKKVSKSLEEHDKRFHPNGYKEGQKCEFRESLEKKDKTDTALQDDTIRIKRVREDALAETLSSGDKTVMQAAKKAEGEESKRKSDSERDIIRKAVSSGAISQATERAKDGDRSQAVFEGNMRVFRGETETSLRKLIKSEKGALKDSVIASNPYTGPKDDVHEEHEHWKKLWEDEKNRKPDWFMQGGDTVFYKENMKNMEQEGKALRLLEKHVRSADPDSAEGKKIGKEYKERYAAFRKKMDDIPVEEFSLCGPWEMDPSFLSNTAKDVGDGTLPLDVVKRAIKYESPDHFDDGMKLGKFMETVKEKLENPDYVRKMERLVENNY